jgi:hypothetical protein
MASPGPADADSIGPPGWERMFRSARYFAQAVCSIDRDRRCPQRPPPPQPQPQQVSVSPPQSALFQYTLNKEVSTDQHYVVADSWSWSWVVELRGSEVVRVSHGRAPASSCTVTPTTTIALSIELSDDDFAELREGKVTLAELVAASRAIVSGSDGDDAALAREAQLWLRLAGTVLREPEQEQPLSAAERRFFEQQGFLLCPDLLSPARCETVASGVDEAVVRRPGGYHKRNAAPLDEYIPTAIPALGALVTYRPMMALVRSLMDGDDFALHHLHCYRHDAGCPGSNWHHDHRHSVLPRKHRMVYCFYYPAGLDGTIGDLLLLPRSHHSLVSNSALSAVMFSDDLPGSLTIDHLPRGSAVLVDGALLHARRPKPGGSSRFFVDISYCEQSTRSRAYGSLEKHTTINRAGLTAGHGGPEGEFDFVFNTACFYDESNATDEELLEIEMEARAARTTAAIFSGDARSALRPQAVIAAL